MFHEKITSELRRFIEVNNHEAVQIGDLEKNLEVIMMVMRKSNVGKFPGTRPSEKGWAN